MDENKQRFIPDVFCIMKYSGKTPKKGGIARLIKKNIKKFCFMGN